MRRASSVKVILLVGMGLGVALGGCITSFGDNLRGKAKRTDELTAPVGDATAVKVTANVGTIRLHAAEVDEVHITADITIKAKTDEEAQELLDGVRISAGPSGDTLVIEAQKPAGFGHNQLAVDFTIEAPAGLHLDCTTNVGDIRTEGFTGRVEARTDVGTITCTGLRDRISLHTNVGDVRAAYAADAPAALDARISSNVGNIHLEGPREISAAVAADCNVGSIHTDRPVTGTIGKSLRASLGDAKGRVDLHTNVGSIRIE
jgi:hypothetical protein